MILIQSSSGKALASRTSDFEGANEPPSMSLSLSCPGHSFGCFFLISPPQRLILGLGVSLVMLAGLTNAYVWAPGLPASLGACSGPDDPNVHGALGLYDTATGQCYLKCDASFLLDRTTGVVGTCFPKNQNSTSMFFS